MDSDSVACIAICSEFTEQELDRVGGSPSERAFFSRGRVFFSIGSGILFFPSPRSYSILFSEKLL